VSLALWPKKEPSSKSKKISVGQLTEDEEVLGTGGVRTGIGIGIGFGGGSWDMGYGLDCDAVGDVDVDADDDDDD